MPRTKAAAHKTKPRGPKPGARSLKRLVMPEGWLLEEPGWHVHATAGGVCRERSGSWYGYPRGGNPPHKGPFTTAAKAAEWVSSRRYNDKVSGRAAQKGTHE